MKTFLACLLLLSASFAFGAPQKGDDANSIKSDAYPLTTCLVSGEELGGMGEPFVLMFKQDGKPDREVRFCCEMCVSRFNSNPAKYLAKLDAAAAASMEHTMMGAEAKACCAEPKACCAEGPCTACAAKKAEQHAQN